MNNIPKEKCKKQRPKQFIKYVSQAAKRLAFFSTVVISCINFSVSTQWKVIFSVSTQWKVIYVDDFLCNYLQSNRNA